MPRLFIATLLTIALALQAGCGNSNAGLSSGGVAASSKPAAIDEAALSYGGVRVGISLTAAQRKLGPGAVDDFTSAPSSPEVYELTVPGAGNPPRECVRPKETIPPPDTVRFLDYEKARITFIRDRACDFQVWAPGATTGRGVAVGDSLDRAKEAYPELTCGSVDRGEFGTIYRCEGNPSKGVYLWLGGDPINYIEYEPAP